MDVNDLINTAVELRVALRLLNSDRSDEAAAILRNVSAWLVEQAKDMAVGRLHDEWRFGDALLESARARAAKIEEYLR